VIVDLMHRTSRGSLDWTDATQIAIAHTTWDYHSENHRYCGQRSVTREMGVVHSGCLKNTGRRICNDYSSDNLVAGCEAINAAKRKIVAPRRITMRIVLDAICSGSSRRSVETSILLRRSDLKIVRSKVMSTTPICVFMPIEN
jgi:hypothetical protein